MSDSDPSPNPVPAGMIGNESPCRLCGQKRQLVRAHVIPRSFFNKLNDGSGAIRMGTDKPGAYPKRSPIGAYDSSLVCETCEARFSPWDDYANRLLLEPYRDEFYLQANGQKIGYRFEAVDYQKLKLFFVSLLWRASASQHAFYVGVRLEKFEEVARRMIMNNDPGNPETFSVLLSKFEHPTAVVMLNPDFTKFVGVNFYRFYFARYVALIKADRRKLPDAYSGLELAPNRALIVLLRDFRSSKELPVLKKLAHALSANVNETLTRQ